jgi:5'-3' exonuclease
LNRRPPKNGEKREVIVNTLLVDGNALFKVGFFGAKNEYNYRGEHIGGIYQFLTVLRKLFLEKVYHNVIVFWDGEFSGKLRYNIYEPYKSGRGKDYLNGTHPIDESEVLQKKMIWNYLEELFIKQIQDEVVESDDFIGYYCSAYTKENITICTTDRDMCQLIRDGVRIYFCDLKTYIDIENYSTYFPHHYDNSVLIKTITGDNSDSIKGIKGVKEQTLLTLFPELKDRRLTIEDILNQAKILQEQRILEKKKPLKALTQLINRVTDGPQGDKIYEINDMLVNLKNPLITDEAIDGLESIVNGIFDNKDRGIKNVIQMMKIDGVDRVIGTNWYIEYLVPFKQLIERELKKTKNYEKN